MNTEPELVLVEDKNDFVDPLDLADEYEDVNDEDKLQLDDAIDEESEFQMEDSDDFGYASSQRAGSDRLKTEATTCLDSDDYDDCHDEYDGFDDSDSDDFFNSPLMPKRNIEHSTETNCLKSEPSHIKKECVKNVAHKVRLSPQMVDDDLSEDDISIGKNSRKTRKASQKGNEKQPKRESNDKNEPMEPRLYKHKKDYRKLLQQYEEMVAVPMISLNKNIMLICCFIINFRKNLIQTLRNQRESIVNEMKFRKLLNIWRRTIKNYYFARYAT